VRPRPLSGTPLGHRKTMSTASQQRHPRRLAKLAAAAVLVGASFTSTAAGDRLTESQQIAELMRRPILDEANVTRYPPDELLHDAQQDRQLLSLATSLVGEDHFFRAYEQKLRPLTDKRFPNAAKVRAQLIEVFNLATDFCEGILGAGSGFAHHRDRIPGYVEWDLYSGYEKNFSRPFDTRYTLDDIRGIGELIVRANWAERSTVLVDGPKDLASALSRFLPPLSRALSELQRIEENLPENGRYYFRQRLMRELSRFL
jgi:hypothetical protein